jgi:hypothetical protein
MEMKKVLYFLLHVILPVAVGTAIYLGWRDQDMWVNCWVDAIGAKGLIIRPDFPLPGWVKNSLPDGCWVYAYTSWMLLIWRRVNLWVVTGVVLAVGGELGQLKVVGLVPGTYDNIDMACYLGGFLLSWVMYAKTAPVVRGGGGDHGGAGDREREPPDHQPNARPGPDGVGHAGDGHPQDRPLSPAAGDPARP